MVTAELIDLEVVCALHANPWWQDHGWQVLPVVLATGLACYAFGWWLRGRCPR